MEGRIGAESDGVGKGTLVTFTLPLAEEEGNALASGFARTGRGPTTKQDGTPILVVDDDPRALLTMRDVLRKSGYVPIVTGDPKEVPHLMEKHHPHLVLLDLVLPGVDGVDLVQDLSQTSKALVIFLSTYGLEEVIARAFDSLGVPRSACDRVHQLSTDLSSITPIINGTRTHSLDLLSVATRVQDLQKRLRGQC